MKVCRSVTITILSVSSLLAASKPHVVVLGKWTTVKLQADDDNSAIDLKVRPLFVDGKTKEFTLGPHTKLPSAFSSYSECFASTIPCPRNPVQRAGVGKRADSSLWIVWPAKCKRLCFRSSTPTTRNPIGPRLRGVLWHFGRRSKGVRDN